MNIILTGFMASGKSTVGRILAQICGLKFVDTDTLIEQKYSMSIPEIFRAFGEEYFRSAETEVIRGISGRDGLVAATGGGAVLNTRNIAYLRENGVIVNLSPTESVIRERLSGNDPTRPLANGTTIDEILARFDARRPYYDNCDIKITVTQKMQPEDTADKILEILEEKYEGTIWRSRQQ